MKGQNKKINRKDGWKKEKEGKERRWQKQLQNQPIIAGTGVRMAGIGVGVGDWDWTPVAPVSEGGFATRPPSCSLGWSGGAVKITRRIKKMSDRGKMLNINDQPSLTE